MDKLIVKRLKSVSYGYDADTDTAWVQTSVVYDDGTAAVVYERSGREGLALWPPTTPPKVTLRSGEG